MDRGLQIVPVNSYGIKTYDKAPAESTGQDRGNLVGVARQGGGLFRLDVKFAGRRYCARGYLFRRSCRHGRLLRRSFGEATGTVNCLGGASGKLYLCFLWSLGLRS